MGVTERLRNKGNAYCIVLVATILFVVLAICIPIRTYAEANDLVIEPGSMSDKQAIIKVRRRRRTK